MLWQRALLPCRRSLCLLLCSLRRPKHRRGMGERSAGLQGQCCHVTCSRKQDGSGVDREVHEDTAAWIGGVDSWKGNTQQQVALVEWSRATTDTYVHVWDINFYWILLLWLSALYTAVQRRFNVVICHVFWLNPSTC